MNLEQLPVFVYGTLQRGEQRAPQWPRQPLDVQWATTRGKLHEPGDYPALVDGTDRVLGELWSMAPEDLPLTLQILDSIEGFAQGDEDLYLRRVVECVTIAGVVRRAHTYFFAHPDQIMDQPILAHGPHGLVHWRRLNPQPPDVR
jgi:gamma-glutamylcyclotransferase (GGCT)/AIG2-like uncharacterized protein YtfP